MTSGEPKPLDEVETLGYNKLASVQVLDILSGEWFNSKPQGTILFI